MRNGTKQAPAVHPPRRVKSVTITVRLEQSVSVDELVQDLRRVADHLAGRPGRKGGTR